MAALKILLVDLLTFLNRTELINSLLQYKQLQRQIKQQIESLPGIVSPAVRYHIINQRGNCVLCNGMDIENVDNDLVEFNQVTGDYMHIRKPD